MKNTFCIILPEIYIAISAIILVIVKIFSRKQLAQLSSYSYCCAQATLLKAIFVVVFTLRYIDVNAGTICLYGTFISDKLSIVLKLLVCFSAFASITYSKEYNKKLGVNPCDFSILMLLAALGIMVLVSGANIINIFLGMELSSLAVYGLITANKYRQKSPLTAMRYFVVSALATSIMLYGISLLFGVTKTLYLDKTSYILSKMEIVQSINISYHNSYNAIVFISMIMIFAGVFLKLGVAPFHTWVAALYEDSPTPVGLFIASAGKIAILAFVMRLLLIFKTTALEFYGFINLIGLMSIIVGNITAISERRVKKIIAFSSVANMGYVLLGMIPGSHASHNAMMFFITSYVLATVTIFGAILAANSLNIRVKNTEDLQGLNTRSPLLSSAFLLSLMSISGIPPLVGFIAKLFVLKALMHSSFSSVAILALLFSAIGVYYSIRMVNEIYFSDRKFNNITHLIPKELRYLITVSMILMLTVSIIPSILICASKMSF